MTDPLAQSTPRHRAWRALAWCLPAVAVVLLYFQVRSHTFIDFDDRSYTTENPVVTRGLTWDGVVWAFSGTRVANYHPLTWLSHMLDYELFGDRPGIFACINALLHALNALLVARLFERLFGSMRTGVIVGIIFAAHPVLVEAVAWISQRKTVLATFFALASLLAYLSARSPDPARTRPWMYVVSTGLFALSLLAKSMYVTLPAVLLLIEAFGTPMQSAGGPAAPSTTGAHFGRAWNCLRATGWRVLPFVAGAIAIAAATYYAQEKHHAVHTLTHTPLGHRIGTALVGCASYVTHFVYPADLSVVYPRPDAWPVSDLGRAAGLLVGVTAILAGFCRRLGWAPLIGWGVFLGMLLPVIGLVQVGEQASADRYMYGPILGLLFCAAALAHRVPKARSSIRTRRILEACLALWMTFAALLTFRQVGCWKDTFTLATRSLDSVGPEPQLLSMAGTSLMRIGQYDGAIAFYERGLKIAPTHLVSLQNLAVSRFAIGQTDLAIATVERLLRMEPDNVDAWVNLALFLSSLRRDAEARAALDTALSRGTPGRSTQVLIASIEAELATRAAPAPEVQPQERAP